MKFRGLVIGLISVASVAVAAGAQTQKALNNADIVNLTKQGFEASLIVTDIQSSAADFDTSPQALMDLKAAGVDKSVMEAMLNAQANKPSGAVEAVRSAAPDGAAVDPNAPNCTEKGCLLREGSPVALKFVADLNSKTANEGDAVEFTLDDDIKVGDAIVVAKGAHAVATVSHARRAGMVGRPGELDVQIQYVIAGSNHVRIRGNKGREGDSRTGAAVALTVLFGPVGLIKHGKNVDIPAGTALTAYVDQDIWLAPVKPSVTANAAMQ
jgi:hypothetical protein